MASIRKHTKGYRAQIDRSGIRKSKTFVSRQEAKDWAAHEEYKILHGEKLAAAMKFGEVLERYAREVSPQKRGHKWEVMQIERILRGPLSAVRLKDLSPAHFSDWRDDRARTVAAGTIRREKNLLSAVLSTARKDWGLIHINPLEGVRMPPEPRPRDRLPSADELVRLQQSAGEDLSTARARVFHTFRFSCETAMRAGEVVGMSWDDIDLDVRAVHLPKTKNGHPSDVPLSGAAVELLLQLPKLSPVFGLNGRSLDALFRKIKARALVEGLTYHDSRAAALTMLLRKVDVMTLAKISGHRDLRILMNTYYREIAADIAKRL